MNISKSFSLISALPIIKLLPAVIEPFEVKLPDNVAFPSPFTINKESFELFGGDKVIQTSNNYDLMVMNGDIGYISKKVENKIIVNFDNREVEYSGLDLYDLDLAYAISIHKSQGSEYSAVIIPINSEHIHMLSRNLLYTAITRGKKLVVLVGEKNIFENAINAFWKDTRYTNLVSAMQSNIN